MVNVLTNRFVKLLRKNQTPAQARSSRHTMKPTSFFDAKYAQQEVEELQGERSLEEARDQFIATAPHGWL